MIDKQKHEKIYSILFGEGLVNDAVAIILFKSVTVIVPSQDTLNLDTHTFFKLIGNFLYISVVSVLIGILTGLIHCIILKKLR
jgi:NhaP-type Na+/H+ or K+/H+ antiporter